MAGSVTCHSICSDNDKVKFLAGLLGTTILLTVSVHAAGKWPREFYPPRAYPANSKEDLPRLRSAVVDGYIRTPGFSWWSKPINETGQLRTYGNDKWEQIYGFPSSMNGCHNGVFLMHWRSSGGPVLSAVGYGYGNEPENIASRPASYGYIYGNNCVQPLFKSDGNNINNVAYRVYYFKFGI